MKKYTIKDSWGNKRIVYVKDLTHTVKLNNSKFRDDNVKYKIEVYSTGKPLFDLDKLDKLEKRYQKIGEEAYQQLLYTSYMVVSKKEIIWAREVSNNPKKYIASPGALEIAGIGPDKYKVKIVSNDPKHYRIVFYDMSIQVAKQIRKEMNRFYVEPLKKFFNKPNVSDVTPYSGD